MVIPELENKNSKDRLKAQRDRQREKTESGNKMENRLVENIHIEVQNDEKSKTLF